jgi:hypothetical protein
MTRINVWSVSHVMFPFCFNVTDDGKEEDIGSVDQLEQLNLQLLRTATDNFSEANKLGEGGFGEVFKVCFYTSKA